jgi:hypothetical protein
MANIPTCIITGRVAGDRLACGDCDPCALGASSVPDAVKRLLAERDDFMDKYAEAMMTIDELTEKQPAQ